MCYEVIEKINKYFTSGQVVFLLGDLGVGKTFLVKKYMENYHNYNSVSSPTFAIKNDYLTDKKSFSHYDLYRDTRKKTVLEMLGEDIRDGKKIFIEWPHNIKKLKKISRLEIQIFDSNGCTNMKVTEYRDGKEI